MSEFPDGFEPIGTARYIKVGTVADLLFGCGRVRRYVWEERAVKGACVGRAVAWWPLGAEGKLIGLYTPKAWKPVTAALSE